MLPVCSSFIITHKYVVLYDKSFKEALKARRTFYRIQNKSTLSDKEIRDLIRFAVEFVPSAFNSQTTRVVLLTGKAHESCGTL